jgi:hypothetical protein
MEYIIHQLKLHRTIAAPSGGIAPDGTQELVAYRSLVGKKDLEPPDSDQIAERSIAGEISAGLYLFTQGILPDGATETEREALFREAAKAVWLEALWREAEFKNDRVLVRILSEESKTVFQIFREIPGEDN